MIILILLGLAILVFEVLMFVDVIQNKKLTDNERALWAIGMVLVHPIVAIVYYFIARSKLDRS